MCSASNSEAGCSRHARGDACAARPSQPADAARTHGPACCVRKHAAPSRGWPCWPAGAVHTHGAGTLLTNAVALRAVLMPPTTTSCAATSSQLSTCVREHRKCMVSTTGLGRNLSLLAASWPGCRLPNRARESRPLRPLRAPPSPNCTDQLKHRLLEERSCQARLRGAAGCAALTVPSQPRAAAGLGCFREARRIVVDCPRAALASWRVENWQRVQVPACQHSVRAQGAGAARLLS